MLKGTYKLYNDFPDFNDNKLMKELQEKLAKQIDEMLIEIMIKEAEKEPLRTLFNNIEEDKKNNG